MNVQSEIGMGLHLVENLLQQKAVGAKVNMFAALQDAFYKIKYMRVEERFSTGYGYYRRRAFINRLETFFQGHHLLDRVGILADSATAGTGEIAEMGRFKHEYKWKLVDFLQFVADNIGREINV